MFRNSGDTKLLVSQPKAAPLWWFFLIFELPGFASSHDLSIRDADVANDPHWATTHCTTIKKARMTRWRSVSETSIIRHSSVFAEEVRSMLPYREITKAVKYESSSGIMIDEERIVCLAVSGFCSPTATLLNPLACGYPPGLG